MESIELKNVSKYYSDGNNANKGLDGVSLAFKRGEFVAITGESGSGKTTLLNVASTLMEIDQGDLFVDGEDTYEWTEDQKLDFRRRNVGFVFQEYNIIPGITALENVLLALYNVGYQPKEAKEKAVKALEAVGLSAEKSKKVSLLSGGERQRVVIARALASDSTFLAIDEPTGNLDSKTGKEIVSLIESFAKDRLVLYVTHDYESVKDFATRHVELKDGKVVKDEQLRGYEEPSEMTVPDKKPVRVFSSSLRILFSSAGRFAVLALSLILFALASMGIAFGINYSEDKWIFSVYEPLNYFALPDPNSLMVLPGQGESVDTASLQADGAVVDVGDISSIARIAYPNLAEAIQALDQSFSPSDELFLAPSALDASSYREAYRDSSVQDGIDLYLNPLAPETQYAEQALKGALSKFFSSSPSPTSFYADSNEGVQDDGVFNGVQEFIDLNSYVRDLKVRAVYYNTGQSTNWSNFFHPSSAAVYRDFLDRYSKAYLKSFSTDAQNGGSGIRLLTGTPEDGDEAQIQFLFDEKPLAVTETRTTPINDEVPFRFPSSLSSQRDRLSIKAYGKQISFDEYLSAVNAKFNKQYNANVATGSETAEEKRNMSFSTDVESAVVVNGLFSVLRVPFESMAPAFSALFENRVRVYHPDQNKLREIRSSLSSQGIETYALTEKTPLLAWQRTANNIFLTYKIAFYIGLVLVYLFFKTITAKIERNITQKFANDDHVLQTLGYSRKRRLYTKVVILAVPTLITTSLAMVLLSSVGSLLIGVSILPFLYIYFIFLLANLFYSVSMAYQWQKKEGGF